MGREEIVKNLEPYLAQMKGNVQEMQPVKMMRNGETRTILIAGRYVLSFLHPPTHPPY